MNSKLNISIIISAYNEEEKIEECLKSVKDFASEIIVVDNSSTDKTYEIAKKYTDKVYSQNNDPQKIDIQKNFGIQKATSDWVFVLDADERIPENLVLEIKNVIADDKDIAGYEIPRKNIIFGKWIEHSLWWPDYQLRLFKKGLGEYSSKSVHQGLSVDGNIGKLENPFIHENYETISQYIYKMDTIYTENEANAIISSGKKLNFLDAIRMPSHDFLKTFFLQEGYKDGLHGLVLSLLQAFYSLIVFAKVWEKQGFKEENNSNFLKLSFHEMKKIAMEFNYWFLTESLKDSRGIIQKTYLKIRRKRVRIPNS